jgi:AmpD protein
MGRQMRSLFWESIVKIDKNTGLLSDVAYLPSPHCDNRPNFTQIDLLVIHGISLPPGQFGTGAIQRFFCGTLDFSEDPFYTEIKHLRVSSHLLITREGRIIQFVPFTLRAWHAGKSYFKGREGCNDFSIGIELEGTNDLPYEKIQYVQLARIIKLLQENYPAMTRDHMVGHSDIAPGRKQDPGPFFSWHMLDECLNLEGSAI